MIQNWFGFLTKDIWGAIPNINAGWIALLSGLFGAVITAFFNYYINIKLAKREQKRKEQRLAYIYLIKVNGIIATEIVLKKYFATELKKLDKESSVQFFEEKIKSLSSNIELAHAFCTLLSTALNDIESEFVDKLKNTFKYFGGLQKYFEEHFAFQMPDELLIQLPKEAVSHYLSFKGNVLGLRTALDLWSLWAQTGEKSLFNADRIYLQWQTLNELSSTAKKLRDVLISAGGISDKEAMALLDEQKNKLIEVIRKYLFAQQIMGILDSLFKKLLTTPILPKTPEYGNDKSLQAQAPQPKTEKPA
jgi:hypothetical protein